ncbi:cell death regulator Aven-like [Mercenaria mercenaria]|uniref:cell death regulator Aven-like n=1 Tax=Mercenaria mercenaria TaxID=6596 RepID=UPI00234F15AE|nr:cell death regulator Aven-like [Mercenaria mercenaria]
MRPDEHKKKKNAQYKKKHGMSEKENKTEAKSKSSAQDKKDKPSNVKGDDSKAQHSDKNIKVKVEETEEVNKHYGRRKLVSNWSRYEDYSDSETEDDIPLQRGEDFNKLLAQAGGAATQFRLKDEEEWNTESLGSTATAVLAVDFENLAHSLDCIPLHERLGIDDHVFTEEQLNEMKAHSAENEQKYRAAADVIKTDDKMKAMDRSENTGSNSSKVIRKPGSSAIENNDTKKTSDIPTQNMTVDKVNMKNDKVQNKLENKQKNKDFAKQEVEELEDDLDMILSFGDTNDKKVEPVYKVDRIIDKDAKVKIEKVNAVDMECVSKAKEKKGHDKGKENLEDWLDSMLDD